MSGCPMQMNGESSWRGGATNETEQTRVTYGGYLQLDKVLASQALSSEKHGSVVPEEHLFIILHQAFELWFKQILYDIDVVRVRFGSTTVDGTMKIAQGLDRIIRIFKLLNEQILILETMSPSDFIEFRKNLGNASGFDSLQFRLLENKLGLTPHSRGTHSELHYKSVFVEQKDLQTLDDSERMPTLQKLVEGWLERIADDPALQPETVDSFWDRYVSAVNSFVSDMRIQAEAKHKHEGEEAIQAANAEIDKTKESFDSLIDEEIHRSFIEKGIRHLSHKAVRVALMIYCYREDRWFAQLFQILNYLMDIDAQLAKWRYNHVMLVQRMLGSKQGTGGSSGYYYLRSTLGDRHRVFMDIFNLSTWILPRALIAPLDSSSMLTVATTTMHVDVVETHSIQKYAIKSSHFG